MTQQTRCAARQYADQTYCHVCRLTWDTNDPEPPPCGRMARTLEPVEPRLPFASGLQKYPMHSANKS